MARGSIMFWSLLALVGAAHENLKVEFEWSAVPFEYPNLRSDLLSGAYDPTNAVVLDSDFYKGVFYVTTPSLLEGSPITLSTVSNKTGKGGKVLLPFPNYAMHSRFDCDKLISVFRIKIDYLGRLWAIDNGLLENFAESSRSVCTPRIFVFDLNNGNRLIRRYTIPSDQLPAETLPLEIEVQVLGNNPQNTWVYIADPAGMTMFVYDFKTDSSFPISHPYFYPEPKYGFYDLNGVSFTLMDGLFEMALVGDGRQEDCPMYFHSLSSGHQSAVLSSILRNQTKAKAQERDFRLFPQERKRHVSSAVITSKGIMIFASLEDNALVAWNIRTKYHPSNFKVLVRDEKLLQFVTGMKLIDRTVLATSTRLQNVIVGQVDKGAVNYRVLSYQLDRSFF